MARPSAQGGRTDSPSFCDSWCEETRGVRFRLSSIEPLEVDAAVLDAVDAAGERIAHHFHLPLQSGSDAVLRRMSRPYTAEEYLRVAGKIATRFPDAAIGADVIVGFPGETEDRFRRDLPAGAGERRSPICMCSATATVRARSLLP